MIVGSQGGGTKYVYLDIYSSIPYIKFKVYNDGKFELIKDNSGKLKDYEQFTIDRTIDYEQQRLNEMWERDIDRTAKFVSEHRDISYNISISGGKDSEVLYNLWKEMLTRLDFVPDYEFIFFNTSNEVADVYKYIKARKDIRIINPEIGWYQYIKRLIIYCHQILIDFVVQFIKKVRFVSNTIIQNQEYR